MGSLPLSAAGGAWFSVSLFRGNGCGGYSEDLGCQIDVKKPPSRSRYLRDTVQEVARSRSRARVRGEVRFDDGSRALYATDSSNYRQVPVGVVIPRDADDVEEAVAVCREHQVPILARGAGTSLAGQACNVAVVFDFSKYMHHIRELDPVRRIARVEPGVVLDICGTRPRSTTSPSAPTPPPTTAAPWAG